MNLFDIITKDRKYIMGIAMLMIMLFHENFLEAGFFQEMRRWGHLGVDIFLFLSGYGIAHSLTKNSIKVFYWHRIKRLLPSCLFWGTVSFFIATCIDGGHAPLRYYVLSPLSLDKWFIYTICLFYLLSPVLYKLCKDNFVFFMAASFCVPLVICRVDLNGWWPINWAIGRFAVYSFGFAMYFTPHIKFKLSTIVVSALFLLSEVLIQCSGNQGFMYLFFIPAIPMVCLIIHWLKALTDRMNISKAIEYLGIYSLEIYLCHEMIFAQVGKICKEGFFAFFLAMAISLLLAPLPVMILSYIEHHCTRAISK